MEFYGEEIIEKLCADCPARSRLPETFTDPGEDVCPVNFMPEDPGCVSHDYYLEILGLAEAFEEVLA
jgi:hypothetical protein